MTKTLKTYTAKLTIDFGGNTTRDEWTVRSSSPTLALAAAKRRGSARNAFGTARLTILDERGNEAARALRELKGNRGQGFRDGTWQTP